MKQMVGRAFWGAAIIGGLVASFAQTNAATPDPSSEIHALQGQLEDSLVKECPRGDINVDACIYRPMLRNSCFFLATSAASDLYSIQTGQMSFSDFQQTADNESGNQGITDRNVASILKAGGINYTPPTLLTAVFNVCMTNFKR